MCDKIHPGALKDRNERVHRVLNRQHPQVAQMYVRIFGLYGQALDHPEYHQNSVDVYKADFG